MATVISTVIFEYFYNNTCMHWLHTTVGFTYSLNTPLLFVIYVRVVKIVSDLSRRPSGDA